MEGFGIDKCVAVQCVSFGVQCDGGPVRAYGKLEDADESGE